jgi:hypothetical protein
VIAHSPEFAVRDFAGEIEFLLEEMQKASVLVTVNAGSLEITDEVSSSGSREIGRVMRHLRGQSSFSILQSDFGLRVATVAGGALKLKDELKCGYFVLGRRQN